MVSTTNPPMAITPYVDDYEHRRRQAEIMEQTRPQLEAELERIDSEVDGLLWVRTTAPEKAAAEAEVRRELRGRRPEAFNELVRRRVVKASRAEHRIPPVSLYYY